MSDLPKFIIATDRYKKREFVVHTQNPFCIAEAVMVGGEQNIEVIKIEQTETDPLRLAGLMSRMSDWYYSVIKERSANENH